MSFVTDVDASLAARQAALAAEAAERILDARRKVKKICEASRFLGYLDPQQGTAAESPQGDITINVRILEGGTVVSLQGGWKLRFVIGDVSRALGGAVPYTYRRVSDDKVWPLVAVDTAQSAGQRTIRPVVELADLADIIVRA